jgi:hypothetical protein
MEKFNFKSIASRIEKYRFSEWQWIFIFVAIVLHIEAVYALWLILNGLVMWRTVLFGLF